MHASMDYTYLANLEKSAYRTVVDDGVLDICLGYMVLVFGLVFATDINLFGEFDAPLLLLPLNYFLWKGLRSQIVEPRVGFVRLHATRRKEIKRGRMTVALLHVAIALGVAALVEWDTVWSAQLHDMWTIIASLTVAVPLGIASTMFQVKRWLLYASVVVVATIIEFSTGSAFGIGWLGAGGVILVSGLFVLLAFLRAHPLHANLEGANA